MSTELQDALHFLRQARFEANAAKRNILISKAELCIINIITGKKSTQKRDTDNDQ